MKVIIAGSRGITDDNLIREAIYKSGFNVTEVVSGHAIGVDRAGEAYAQLNNLKVTLFIPDWNKHGRGAGFIRNEQMAEYADALIAIWDGESKGTKHMIDIAKKKNLQVYVLVSMGIK